MSDIEPENFPEKNETPFVNGDRPYTPLPERHGCITTFLIFGLIFNSIGFLVYLFIANKPIHLPKISVLTEYCLIIICMINIFFCVKLLRYKKSGFYGLAATSIVIAVINYSIGISPIVCLLSPISGMLILYWILNVKRNGIPAWRYLK